MTRYVPTNLVVVLSEPEGYRISEHNQQGIALFTFDYPEDTEVDKLAFGFMTWQPNGTMVRAESGFSADYIHAKLVSVSSPLYHHETFEGTPN